MSLARAKAQEVIKDLSIDSAETLLNELENICMARGAFVQYDNLDGAEGRIVMSKDGGIITVDPSGAYGTRKRFSVAHELGHFELHRKDGAEFLCSKFDLQQWSIKVVAKKIEAEANEFAGELLMPEQFVKPQLKGVQPSFDLLEKLSETFGTSLSASGRRFIDLTAEACALVTFNNAGIQYHWRSKRFSEQGYWVSEGPIGKGTFAFDALAGKGNRGMSQVDAEEWFTFPAYLGEQTIREQAKYFPNLEMGLSLLWIDNPALIIK